MATRCTLVLALVGVSLVPAACGGEDSTPQPATTRTAEAPPPEPVTLELEKLSKETTEESIEMRGVVTEDARVLVNGKRAKVKGERFSISLPLDLGKNQVRVVATAERFDRARESATVRRTEPPVAEVPGIRDAEEGTVSEVPGAPDPGDETHCNQMELHATGECIVEEVGPADPEDCPPGQVPVGQTGACGRR